MQLLATALLLCLGICTAAAHDDNGLARTPQMGWNTWNKFGCGISEETVLSAARALVSSGLRDFGYEYVIIDDCWQAPSRDPQTQSPRADPTRFPRGIKAVADEVHELGLKVGIYSDAGKFTCGRRFGSLDFEEIDANTYASWEIDYLKYDNCYNEGRAGYDLISFERFARMSRALNATGRPILYSLCNWGEDGPWNWATTIANSWRISGDITDKFDRYDDRCPCTSAIDCKLPGFHCAVTRIIDYSAPLGQKAGPGRWNDLDMLEIGNGGMSYDEYVVHFSIWALVKSPLVLGNDVTKMTSETLSIITNDAIIAVNQDPVGSPAVRLWREPQEAGGTVQLWAGPLANGATIIALLNTSPISQIVTIDLEKDVFMDSDVAQQKAAYRLFDLWQRADESNLVSRWGKDVGVFQSQVPSIYVDAHQIKVWKAVPADAALAVKEQYRLH
ncbi:glycoside hydrolase family 27 protein [Botryobasidium botryosum FD-172 SS1]|uniref:Alpha-galactosidase n=1 Tax=Botryobasidium botryosum (strain FD-172 SS1) TaxID=930990 RepID=A0A067M484_BOTB1|nr:glycoside hydrolase family 27 protein [Botryobasidium botryosum FD-172 SS1]